MPARTDYRTVQADPHHDSQAASLLHQKALRIVDRYLAGKTADLPKAEEQLQKALVADVTFGPAHNTLGTLYLWKGQLYLAAWEFEYAAKVMPERAAPLYNLGMVYEKADKLDQAIMQYEQAHALEPNNPATIGNLARARLRNSESVDDVRPLLEQLVAYDTRPTWLCWAKDLLGVHPSDSCPTDAPSLDTSSIEGILTPPADTLSAVPLPANEERSTKQQLLPGSKVPLPPTPESEPLSAPNDGLPQLVYPE